MASREKVDEVRGQLSQYVKDEDISVRELSRRTKYSDSQLRLFLKGNYNINVNTYKRLRSFLAGVKSAETFEPIDIAIEHLEKAKSKILKAQKDINELADFLVKKVGDVVQLRSFLLGRK